MRGKAYPPALEQKGGGITPAHAGKSVGYPIFLFWGQDHPRTCGEKEWKTGYCDVTSGSPPHMRGKDTGTMGYGSTERITPAHAGKRRLRTHEVQRGRDHPRTCGEKGQKFLQMGGQQGSPPHMRGKVDVLPEIDAFIGITPAHAGKSETAFIDGCNRQDHPRTCGEKEIPQMKASRTRGSPPHMRGKGSHPVPALHNTGITPAHAGKSVIT